MLNVVFSGGQNVYIAWLGPISIMTHDGFICSTYCLVVGEGKDISNMTQDAKLVHMLNIVFCVGKGLNL